MPGMDGTGPMGNGPFGRGMGPCGGGFAGGGRRRGFRRGGGLGWGRSSEFIAPLDRKEVLERQKKYFETQLDEVNKELEKNSEIKTGE